MVLSNRTILAVGAQRLRAEPPRQMAGQARAAHLRRAVPSAAIPRAPLAGNASAAASERPCFSSQTGRFLIRSGMARISIVHSTEYTYRNPVGLLRHRLMLRPDDSHDLRLQGATLAVEPQPTRDLLEARRLRQLDLLPRMARGAQDDAPEHRVDPRPDCIIPTARHCPSIASSRRPIGSRSPMHRTRLPILRA